MSIRITTRESTQAPNKQPRAAPLKHLCAYELPGDFITMWILIHQVWVGARDFCPQQASRREGCCWSRNHYEQQGFMTWCRNKCRCSLVHGLNQLTQDRDNVGNFQPKWSSFLLTLPKGEWTTQRRDTHRVSRIILETEKMTSVLQTQTGEMTVL